jgi:hypothetical protein
MRYGGMRLLFYYLLIYNLDIFYYLFTSKYARALQREEKKLSNIYDRNLSIFCFIFSINSKATVYL